MDVEKKRILQKLFAEFLASFIFGFAVYSAILNTKSDSPTSGTTVGLTVCFAGISLIYTFCDHTISHFNPALTFATIITGKLDPIMGTGYIIVQLIGFFLASILCVVCFPYDYMDTLKFITASKASDNISNINLFFEEFSLSFILAFVAFEVGVNAIREPGVTLFVNEPQVDRSKLAPLTIGFTLGFLAFLASTTSGGAFNPGLVFGPAIASGDFTYFWIFITSELTGALLGALVQVFILFK
ncbi:MIP plasma membrane transporter [Nucleospora cyclopteri]